MANVSRRTALSLLGVSAGVATLGQFGILKRPLSQQKVLVIGGGPGGTAAALDLKAKVDGVDVTLVEQDPTKLTKTQTNSLIPFASKSEQFRALKDSGVHVAIDEVVDINWLRSKVVARSGRRFSFDKIILAPGIGKRQEAIEGYGREAAYEWPHAWFGSLQARRLAARLQSMDDGGTFIIRVPEGTMRYPQGPYERAGAVAKYLAREKPRSKILILDTKDDFPNRDEFLSEWQTSFPKGMVEWVAGSKGGHIDRVDVAAGQLYSGSTSFKGDVINFIPAQQAGDIAVHAGLAGTDGWCPVDGNNYRSLIEPQAFIIGDAAASNKSKNADVATKQGASIASLLIQS